MTTATTNGGAAPAPAEEPPVLNARFHGLRTMPNIEDTPAASSPQSGMVVLAKMVAPVSFSRIAGGES